MNATAMYVLLHYQHRTDDPYDGVFEGNNRLVVDWLRDEEGLIEHNTREDGRPLGGITNMYRLTDRGRVFVEALLETPLPVASWEMPT